MVFHSANFLVFFILLLAAYYLFKRGRTFILAVGNVLFYAASGIGVLLVFMVVTSATFFAVHGLHRTGRRLFLWLGLFVNIGNLVFFKYTMFVADTLEGLLGAPLPFRDALPAEIVLPVGISFYTFQLISYLVDVYRGEIAPTRSLLKFWVYISLFPQLVAGPIMRGSELMPQLDDMEAKSVRWEEIKYGVYLVMAGLLKKVALADPIASFVNPLFAKGEAISGVESWWAAYAFGFQIYFDFSAYSDMAMGLASMLGIRLIVNFRTPYLSSNPREFWSRWHISLSRWIRDYIYIPLGGNRRKPLRVHFNLMAAMVISGLWHGAMWTFVLWGAVHGMLQLLYRWSLHLNRWETVRRVRESFAYRVVAVFVFFHVVTWTWVFFRAESFAQAWTMSQNMWTVSWPELFASGPIVWLAALYALHAAEYGLREHEQTASRLWHKVPFILRSLVYLALVLVIFYFLKGETYEFIYFQF